MIDLAVEREFDEQVLWACGQMAKGNITLTDELKKGCKGHKNRPLVLKQVGKQLSILYKKFGVKTTPKHRAQIIQIIAMHYVEAMKMYQEQKIKKPNVTSAEVKLKIAEEKVKEFARPLN